MAKEAPKKAAVDAAMAQAEADDDGPARGKRSKLHTAQGSNYKPVKSNQATINIILSKATLQTMQNVRDLLSAVWQYTIIKKSTVVATMKAVGTDYDAKVKEKKKGHGLGPPCIGAFAALLDALVDLGTGKSANNHTRSSATSAKPTKT